MAKKREGKVKTAVNKVLDRYPESYVFKSVPFGYGPSTLDYLVCHYGRFVSIETKAPGAVPTPRQDMIIDEITGARGKHFTIDGTDKCGPLEAFLEQVKQDAASTRQSETSIGGSSPRSERSQFISRRDAIELWRNPAHRIATSADGDASITSDGVRRPEPDTDTL